MNKLILVKYGEISLKKNNRNYFFSALIRNIKNALHGIDNVKCNQIQGRITIENIPEEMEDIAINKLQKVFGITSLTRAFVLEPDMEEIKNTALNIMRDKTNLTFKVSSKRSDKTFPLKSPEISKIIGAHILVNTDTLTVDVHKPDIHLIVEIRDKAYLYYENIPGESGLPIGVSGKGGLLLSGGIDSPVAGFMMARRGMKIDAIHFHSYPFTSLEAKQKVLDIANKLVDFNQGICIYTISLTNIQEEILKKCDPTYITVILRRFMLRCAEILAERYQLQALITGESLGQVASQTIESITCTNEVVTLPILRPLIGIDKNDIIKIAKHIDTYDISILPYEDCCTLFVPKNPQTKPSIENVLSEEDKLDIDLLTEQAIETLEIIKH